MKKKTYKSNIILLAIPFILLCNVFIIHRSIQYSFDNVKNDIEEYENSIVSYTKSYGTIDSIIIRDIFQNSLNENIIITKGDHYSVTYNANIPKEYTFDGTSYIGNTLNIATKYCINNKRLTLDNKIDVEFIMNKECITITVPTLNYLELEGVNNVQLEGFNLDSLTIFCNRSNIKANITTSYIRLSAEPYSSSIDFSNSTTRVANIYQSTRSNVAFGNISDTLKYEGWGDIQLKLESLPKSIVFPYPKTTSLYRNILLQQENGKYTPLSRLDI